MNNKIYYILLAVITTFASCNYLDTPYDDRARIDVEDKVGNLLVSAYSTGSEWCMAEMASDNIDHILGNWDVVSILQEEAYFWKNVSENRGDSPDAIWSGGYTAISNANLALESIEELEKTNGISAKLQAYKAEALLCRAYAHFVMANIFCKPYGASSATDKGLPYMDHLENTVSPHYERGTVAELYEKINADIEAALPYISDSYMAVPKYHFNKQAAYAFAARFNLYYRKYDKTVQYAGQVLGADLSSTLRNWSAVSSLSSNGNFRPDWFIGKDNPATLLDRVVYSSHPYVIGPYNYGCRYTMNNTNATSESLRTSTPWGGTPYFQSSTFTQIPKVLVNKYALYFEYTDPVAQIGYRHMIQVDFSTDETLMCRAEANILLGNYEAAVNDLNAFMSRFLSGGTSQTIESIVNFYDKLDYYTPTKATPKKKLNPDFTIEAGTQENMLHCLLHLRRILTVHEGLRWYDIRRYGIEIYRRDIEGTTVVAVTDSLKKDDLRRTIQLPQSVVSAGMEANPR
jgi:hypothetical protein